MKYDVDAVVTVLRHPDTRQLGQPIRHGATLVMGSDWSVSSPNPLEEMHVAVNRKMPPSYPFRVDNTEVFLPLRNEPDLDDVPAEVRDALTVHIVGDVLDVVRGALTAPGQAERAAGSDEGATAAA